MQFPTWSDAQAGSGSSENYGLRTALIGGEGYGDATATDIFIHGRDYSMKEPDSIGAQITPDAGILSRTYFLYADNTFSGNTWTGRTSFVSPDRLKTFCGACVGYPYVMYPNGIANRKLYRHLPEPFRSGSSGISWQYSDNRGSAQGSVPTSPAYGNQAGNTLRYDFHCTTITSIHGVAEHGQGYGSRTQWNPYTQSAIWSPSSPGTWSYPTEAYPIYEIAVNFERLPYEVMTQDDPAFYGEYSRFVLPQENANTRALQIRGVVSWNQTSGLYGQPTDTTKIQSSTPQITASEGVPILANDNLITWKWIDVPWNAFQWIGKNAAGQYNGISVEFGKVNSLDADGTNAPFPPGVNTPYAPFTQYNSETMLFQTATRVQKPSFGGQSVWDITFYFNYSPGNDGMGYWNRLLNAYGVLQRIKTNSNINNGNVYNSANDWSTIFMPDSNFQLLFMTPDYWK